VLGCNMSLRLCYLHSQLDYFTDNLGGGGVLVKVRGEIDHQDFERMQRRCQGLWDVNKMADDCSPSNQQPPARTFTGH
jgi:hypothetical protein